MHAGGLAGVALKAEHNLLRGLSLRQAVKICSSARHEASTNEGRAGFGAL